MFRRLNIAGMAVLVILLATTFVFAQAEFPASPPADGRHKFQKPPPRRPLWQNQRLIDLLDLSTEQVSELREHEFLSRAEMIEIRAEVEQAQLQLDIAFSAETFNAEDVREAARALSEVHACQLMHEIDNRIWLHTQLTSEQMRMFKECGRKKLSDTAPHAGAR